MRLSVITPSFNQAQFLPFNLESVARQTFGDVEQIVVDPGSTDASREIAARSSHVTLIAEPDRGQSDGISKGFERSTGDILTWLNSDDFYPTPNVVTKVVKLFEANPEIDVVYGNVDFVGEAGEFLRKGFVNKDAAGLLKSFEYQVGIVQPGVFMRRRVFDSLGGPSENYEYCMDYEYWVRIASAGFRWLYSKEKFAHHRWWSGMKTSRGRGDSLIEHFKVCHKYFGYIHWKWLDRYADYLVTAADGIVNQATAVDKEQKAARLKEVVDRFVSPDMLRVLAASRDNEHKETLEFVERHRSAPGRHFFDGGELKIAEETSDDPAANERIAWNVFDARAEDGAQFKAYHLPNNFDRYFDAAWLDRALNEGHRRLKALSARRRPTCVIVGNGPSLKKSNLTVLEHADVIISNFASLSPELSRYATVLSIVNDLVAQQGSVELNASRLTKVVPFWLANSINETPETVFVSATVRPVFNGRLDGEFSWRSTVSFFNMQLAFALGYEKVLLIGFDHSYRQPKGVREGDSIDQKSDDENHFDPRYFRGKIWQAADTQNMEAVYRLAREAFDRDGREIVNCTVGGKLEVFRRGVLEEELGLGQDTEGAPNRDRGARSATGRGKRNGDTLPRVLVFDMTAIGDGSASGELKASLFADWPAGRYLQVYAKRPHGIGLAGDAAPPTGKPTADTRGKLRLKKIIAKFDPQLILYRPVPDTPDLHRVAMKAIKAMPEIPLVTWIMDDWPARLAVDDPPQHRWLNRDWLWLLERSRLRLSICEKMSRAFKERYGFTFEPFANGVDPADWPQTRYAAGDEFVIRYAGALAENMSAHSVRRTAEAVEALANEGSSVRLEIATRPTWKNSQQDYYRDFTRTTFFTDLLPVAEYRKWLSEADAVLIAYNFDAESLRYVGLSMANKMPECLASGAAVIAHGPEAVATIAYLRDSNCALVIDEESVAAIRAGLVRLLGDREFCKALGERGRALAFLRHDIHDVRERFYAALALAASDQRVSDGAMESGTAEFSHDEKAQIDECRLVFEAIGETIPPGVMVDVGAHLGGSLASFADAGWTVYAFEPDPANRAKLAESVADKPNVVVSEEAVSDLSGQELPFYASGESTGISGLSAFRDSHREVARVKTIALDDVVARHGLTRIDFLKIDVEGFEMAVLRGLDFAKLSPEVVLAEYEDGKTKSLGYDAHDLCRFFLDRGYTVYVSEWHPIERYGVQHSFRRIRRYPCEIPTDSWGNLIAFKTDPPAPTLKEAIRAATSRSIVFEGDEIPAPDTSASSLPAGGRSKSAARPGGKRKREKVGSAPPRGRSAEKAKRANRKRPQANRPRKQAAGTKSRQGLFRTWPIAIAAIGAALVLLVVAAGVSVSGGSPPFLVLAVAAGAAALVMLGILHDAFKRRLKATRDEMQASTKALKARTQRREKSLLRKLKQVRKSAARRHAEVRAEIGALKTTLGGQSEEIRKELATASDAWKSALEARSISLTRALGEQRATLNEVTGGLGGLRKGVESFSHLNASNGRRVHRRLLEDPALTRIESYWAPTLGMPMRRSALTYLAHQICLAEDLCEGRLATTIETAVLRLLALRSLKRPEISLLEIGVLFGLGAGILYRLRGDGIPRMTLTLIDPLKGYYHESEADPTTGLLVNPDRVRRNLRAMGVSDDDLILLEGLSDEPAIVEAARSRHYDFILIDGDHSGAGVARDFDLYGPLVRPGGLVLFDDYDTTDWPEIKPAVDGVMSSVDDWEWLGSDFRTGIARKRA